MNASSSGDILSGMKFLHLLTTMAAFLPLLTGHAAELVIDPAASRVSVDVKASPPHSFTCDLQAYEADIEVDPATGDITDCSFTFLLTDLETYNDSRNKKMHKWMNVEQHNTIKWSMTSIEETEAGLVARGEMTMHGSTLPVDITFSKASDGGSHTIAGVADLDYMDFGLPKIRLFLFTVNPDLHVHFELRGQLK